MMNLKRKTGQAQEERRIPDNSPVETESTSQLPDVVEYFQTGVPSPSKVVSEPDLVLIEDQMVYILDQVTTKKRLFKEIQQVLLPPLTLK